MPPITLQFAISLTAISISTAALVISLRNYLRKSGVFVRGSFSLASSRDCNDRFVSNIVLENLKDRAVTIFGIYLRVGHSYYVELEELEEKPLVLRAFETYRKELGPIEFYAASTNKVDLNDLLADDKVRKHLVLSTSDGKYVVPHNRNRWHPVGEYFRNHFAAVIHVVPSQYKGRALGSNIRYVVEVVSDNGAIEIVPIHPADFRIKRFRAFPLTQASLETREALEEYLLEQKEAGRLQCSKLAVHDVEQWRQTTDEHYSKERIKVPYVGALQHYALGPVLTKYSDWRMRRGNRPLAEVRNQSSEEDAARGNGCVDAYLKGAMTTDKTQFDTYLKQALHRDIVFRVAVSAAIAVAASTLASSSVDYDAVAFFNDTARKLGPLINIVGVASLVLSLLACVLKDLEHVSPERWGLQSSASWWGGAVRRTAGDLTLWLLSSLVAFFFAMFGATFYAIFSETISLKEGLAMVVSYVVLLAFTLVVSVVNICVRREAPPLATARHFSHWMRSPARVLFAYAALLSMAITIMSLIFRFGP